MTHRLRLIPLLTLASLLILTVCPAPALAEGEPVITIISRATDGTLSNARSQVDGGRSVSGNGRFVVFSSIASNLIPDDTNGAYDLFLHDHWTGTTTLVSATPQGGVGSALSEYGSISLDGRFVAFSSRASNLVLEDTNWSDDIFVRDLALSSTVRVSVSSAGDQANNNSGHPSISADGRFVAFDSDAYNLSPDDLGLASTDIYVRDRELETTILVSKSSEGAQADGRSYRPAISHDGRYVAFYSYATNLVADDTNGRADVFVHDRINGETHRISVSSAGVQGNNDSSSPQISGDGRYVVFYSSASNLVDGDTNAVADIFMHDRHTGETTRLSLSSEGAQANGTSIFPTVTPDGRFVTYASLATNLVPEAASSAHQIYLRDVQGGITNRISQITDGTPANGLCMNPALSADARYVAFASLATNLVTDKPSGTWYDTFLVDRGGAEVGILPLVLDVPETGALQAMPEQLYSLQLEAPGTALVVTITPGAGLEGLRAMGRLNGLPTPGLYDAVAYEPNARGVYELVFEPAATGEYLIALQAMDLSAPTGAYEIVAHLVDRTLASFEPRTAGNAGPTTFSITGAGLDRATGVRLESAGLPTLVAAAQGIASPSALWATFDFTDATPATYRLVVSFDDSEELRLDDPFTLTVGSGGVLKARVITPWITRPDRRYTIWVEYENTGDADLPAPLFILSVEPGVALRLPDRDTVYPGTLQLLGASAHAPASVLPPGSLNRIPLILDTATDAEELWAELEVVEPSEALVNWAAYAATLRPASTGADEWAALWPALQALLGDTWADYLAALGSAADRMQLRDVDPVDVRQLLALLIAQAQGAPVSSIAGKVLDAGTLAPLPDVRVVARHQDEAAVRAELSGPDGAFAIAFLPGGTYELYADGYIVEPPPAVTISADMDAAGVRLLAAPIPPEEDLPPPLVQYAAPQALDAEGVPHLLFSVNGAFYHAWRAGETWAPAVPVPGAAGMDPRLVYAPTLLSGGPGLALFWRVPASLDAESLPVPASIWSAAARPDGAGGWEWSAPAVFNEHPVADSLGQVAVVDDSGSPLVVWQMQALADMEEDSDLYYGNAPLAPDFSVTLAVADAPAPSGAGSLPAGTSVVWTGAGQPVLLSADPQAWSEAFSLGFIFSKSGTVPRWVPYVGGKNEVSLSAALSGLASEGGATVSASLSGELGLFEKKVTGSASGSVGAGWMLDRQACAFNLNQAIVSASLGATGRIPIPQLTYEDPFLQMYKTEVGLQVGASLGGSLTWTGQGYWPEGKVTGGGTLGPYGKVAFGEFAEGAVSGTGGFSLSMDGKKFEFSGLTLQASAGAQVGPFSYSTTWQYPPEIPVPPTATGTSIESALYEALLGMTVETTLTLAPKPGTTMDYGAPAVLADVGADLIDDGRPALALAGDGVAHAFWLRESDDLAVTLGNTLYHATYDGAWSAPDALAGTLGLSRTPAAALDAAGNLVVAWIHADATGWDMASDPEALHQARLAAVVRYGVLQADGTWLAPAALPGTPADHKALTLRALPSGDVWATWVTTVSGERSLWAARWDGTVWSAHAMVAAAPVEGGAAIHTWNSQPTLVWAQSTDDPELSFSQAAELYAASYDGAVWSTPAPLALTLQAPVADLSASLAQSAPVAAASGGLFTLNVAIPPTVCTPPDTPGGETGQFNKDQEPGAEPGPPAGVRTPLDRKLTYIFVPIDPNDKLGPLGYTEARYIDGKETLQYTIRFENLGTAAVPAQQVSVTDLLDADLDLGSLRITEVAYGTRVLPVTDGIGGASLTDVIPDYREGDDRTWIVDTRITLDYASGLLTAVFATLDPLTGELPEDPFAGFLPPNDETGRGEGRITFEIDPLSGLADGTLIANQAEIVFDTEDPISTNTWTNTIGTPFALTVDTLGEGAVLREPWQERYFSGQEVTLTARPDPGWTFVGWQGDVTGRTNPLTLTVTGEVHVMAVFSQYTVFLPLVTR